MTEITIIADIFFLIVITSPLKFIFTGSFFELFNWARRTREFFAMSVLLADSFHSLSSACTLRKGDRAFLYARIVADCQSLLAGWRPYSNGRPPREQVNCAAV